MLELIGLTVRRRADTIVEGLDVRIEPGRPFWVVGPNGAGKSTLLRVLAGLERAAGGRVLWERRPLYFHSEMRLPASGSVGAWAQAADRVREPDRGGTGRLAWGEAAAGRSGLWPAVELRRRIGRLSTGERKRLLLDVLLRHPGPVLLDEPFEHLSPDAKRQLAAALERRAGEAVVVVATNQGTERARNGPGIRIEAGRVHRLGPSYETGRAGVEVAP